ncbi:MAG: porin [Bdellovibrionales bacterium]|nr:porin [Massilia sp.]
MHYSRTVPRTSFVLSAFALAASLAAGAAQAADQQAGPSWTFGGFGSVGVVHSDYDQADFTSSILKGDGAGATHAWSPDLESRIGAQLSVKINKQWSGVMQVISEQRYDGSYRPLIEWGNVKYQATPDLSVRVGRIALPILLAADYRKIGYAYPWVRTPVEVYGAVPITNSDGADALYRWQVGRFKHSTQAFYGKTNIYLTKTTSLNARDMLGLTHTLEYGALTLRGSVLTAVLNTNILRPLFDGFRQFGPQGVAIANKYDVVDKRIDIRAIGVNYDPGKWFVTAEAGSSNGHSYLAKSRAMFVSGGYRAGEFTPYVTYSRTDAHSPTTDPGLSTAGLPPAYAYAASALNAGLDTTLKTIASQTTMTAGARWDFRPNLAFKLQYERVLPRNGSRGTLINLEPGFRSGRAVHLTSAVLDFVF